MEATAPPAVSVCGTQSLRARQSASPPGAPPGGGGSLRCSISSSSHATRHSARPSCVETWARVQCSFTAPAPGPLPRCMDPSASRQAPLSQDAGGPHWVSAPLLLPGGGEGAWPLARTAEHLRAAATERNRVGGRHQFIWPEAREEEGDSQRQAIYRPRPRLASQLRGSFTHYRTLPDGPGRYWTRCDEVVVGMPGLEPGRGLALRILSPVLYSPHVPVKAGFTPYRNRVASLLRGAGIRGSGGAPGNRPEGLGISKMRGFLRIPLPLESPDRMDQ